MVFLVWLFAEVKACVWMVFQHLVQISEAKRLLKLVAPLTTPQFEGSHHNVGGSLVIWILVQSLLFWGLWTKARLWGMWILRTSPDIFVGLNHYYKGLVVCRVPRFLACMKPRLYPQHRKLVWQPSVILAPKLEAGGGHSRATQQVLFFHCCVTSWPEPSLQGSHRACQSQSQSRSCFLAFSMTHTQF